jgi:beta-glucosidase
MDIASFDESTSSWIVESGEYEMKIGASSVKIAQSDKFTVDNEINAGTVSKALVPEIAINRLTKK